MLLPQFIRKGAKSLEALYPPEEARSLVLRLAEDLCGFAPFDYILKPEAEVPDELEDGLRRLLDGEPLQYITGFQEFRGRRFRVTPDVLIPRPETELLVDAAVARLLPEGLVSGCHAPRVLDLCTGSGCVAWSIALEVPGAEVTGVDISEAALDVASSQFPTEPSRMCDRRLPPGDPDHPRSVSGRGPQAQRSGRDGVSEANGRSPEAIACKRSDGSVPRFVKADVLQVPEEFEGAPFDVITANPPYIRESEKARMHRNVLEHEPELALFVLDEDPLLFYRAVAQWAARFLKPGGWGIVEINEELGEETAAVFRAAGLSNVKKSADFYGKERFVSFEKEA